MTLAALVLLVALPAAAFTVWPLLRRGHSRALLPVPPDAREQLLEQKRQSLRTLRELDFEHEAGHVSDDDYAELRARYEGEAAQVLMELDRLGAAAARETPPPPASLTAPGRGGWRHPVALGATAVALVIFGVAIGVGIVRYTEPDASAGMSVAGTRPATPMPPETAAGAMAGGAEGAARPIPPEVMRRMLDAARQSLSAGRYSEAISAYQAVLKRDPKNVDAMTHLGLIVAIGGHADNALETFDKALALDPNYAPALLYRGEVLYESKRDADGAIKSWQKFLTLVPSGEDHERVKQLIGEARKTTSTTKAPK